ncbi:MAG: hypothetical protein N4A57_07505 [Anaeromicrobium sp.]|jgi:YD repeat-containing protein|uniref:hypothetical protein n=1 Tax=Anaeromicrobium sp. TaxID=1929132 RepID=UPI0025CF4F28|nr:hypothetical protein [Anaeromicrobium sp.]MCT4594096.1 hypothetical protein [Anaeromicrobium sp.]
MIDYTSAIPKNYWYLYDAHGSVLALADENGNKVVTYDYDPWGYIKGYTYTASTGDGVPLWKANPFRYSGYQFDDETGMHYLKNRY